MSRAKQNLDEHRFNLIAIKNRIPSGDLNKTMMQIDPEIAPLSLFLPSANDNKLLMYEFTVLIGRTLTKYFPALEWMKGHVPQHISHKYSKEMSNKSEVVS